MRMSGVTYNDKAVGLGLGSKPLPAFVHFHWRLCGAKRTFTSFSKHTFVNTLEIAAVSHKTPKAVPLLILPASICEIAIPLPLVEVSNQ